MKGEGEGETLTNCLPYAPQPGIEPATWICALIRIEPVTLQCTDNAPATLARALLFCLHPSGAVCVYLCMCLITKSMSFGLSRWTLISVGGQEQYTEISRYSGTLRLHGAYVPLEHFSLLEGELMLGFPVPLLPEAALLGPTSKIRAWAVGYISWLDSWHS